MSRSASATGISRRKGLGSSIAKVLLAGGLGLVLSQYLAAFLFLWWFRLDPREARPLTIIRYAYYYGDRSDVRQRACLASASGIGLILLAVVPAFLPKRRSLHGEARFATTAEIDSAGLFSNEGIVLGRAGGWGPFGGRFLILGGQLGAALTAPPRAGKGVSVVIPTLLSWNDSVVCTDIKKENWTVTAGFRHSLGHETHLFDPLSKDGRTSRWNPLDYVSQEPGQRISDLQLIAHMFFPDPPGADPFWAAGGRTLFLGIALYLFATPSLPRTIGEILRQGMANDEEGFSHHWKRVIEGRQTGRFPLPATCVRALSDVIDLAPQTASSIRKTFTSKLELWLNPLLDAATAASDFDLRALRKRPMTIYLGVMPKDLRRLAPLMSLFFQQAVALQTDELPEHNSELKYQVLMLLDEFPAMGLMATIADASGFLPGYNVRLLMIMQAQSQLREVYGVERSKTLLKTVAARVHFAPKEMEDAEEISRELGFTTVKAQTVSKPRAKLWGRLGSERSSMSVSESRRALMLPQEVKEMGVDQQLVFTENVRPIFCKKIRYFLMPVFLRRLRPPPVVPKVEPIAAASQADITVANYTKSVTAFDARKPPETREATDADIERIDDLTAEDIDIDLSGVHVPTKGESERMSAEELSGAVESFLTSLRER